MLAAKVSHSQSQCATMARGKRQEAMDGIKLCRNRRACVLGRRSREKPTFIYIIDLEIALEEGEGERVNCGQPIDSVVFAYA